MTDNKVKYALLSVSKKEGIVEFAQALSAMDIVLLSTGGTAKLLKENDIPVQEITDFTGLPEMMDGRVKTLHPKLYGGILARGDKDQPIIEQQGWVPIGLVVVNLYPFQEMIANEECSLESAIENIDIGGPSLLRAAAKNFAYTAAVVASEDYPLIISQLQSSGYVKSATRLMLAKKVFAHVANYDAAISNYFSALEDNKKIPFPATYTLQVKKKLDLRYGENPHQHAAFYSCDTKNTGNIESAVQLSGKPLSYNNIADADAALECVKQFTETACVIVKHANPCAVSAGLTQLEAYEKAFSADTASAFGGIIAFNTPLETVTMTAILANQFVEVIVAPEISNEALVKVDQKPNIRLLSVGHFQTNQTAYWDLKSVSGGLLIQERDNLPSPLHTKIVTEQVPTPDQMADLLFAWQVVRFVKSNAIVLVKNKMTLGIGPGQMSRIFSSKIAALKAKEAGFSLPGAVMASDAFLPFADSIEEAYALGVTAIIQPGGSIRDPEVISAANKYGIAMVLTDIRHFRH